MKEFRYIINKVILTALFFLAVIPMDAEHKAVGGVDYSQGVNALMSMTSFVTTMMTLTMGLTFAIAGSASVIGALNIYIKMNTGQEGIAKSIMMLVGAVIFMVAATITMPAFFGFQYSGVSTGDGWIDWTTGHWTY